jgi:hypothetical protein
VHAGSKCGGEANVAGHDQQQSTSPADAREVTAYACAVRIVIVAKDDTGEARGELCRGGSRVRQPQGISE